MVISLSNLPPSVSEDDIRQLFHHDDRIINIDFSRVGNPDKVMALVKMDISSFEAQYLAHKLNNQMLRERRIEAYAPIFFKR